MSVNIDESQRLTYDVPRTPIPCINVRMLVTGRFTTTSSRQIPKVMHKLRVREKERGVGEGE